MGIETPNEINQQSGTCGCFFLRHKTFLFFFLMHALFNNVSTFNNQNCMALHAISVCDVVQKQYWSNILYTFPIIIRVIFLLFSNHLVQLVFQIYSNFVQSFEPGGCLFQLEEENIIVLFLKNYVNYIFTEFKHARYFDLPSFFSNIIQFFKRFLSFFLSFFPSFLPFFLPSFLPSFPSFLHFLLPSFLLPSFLVFHGTVTCFTNSRPETDNMQSVMT